MSSRERALLLCGLALEKKAQDLMLIEVGQLTTIADYFIICSGRSDRQVQSIAESILEGGRRAKMRPYASEGTTSGHWVLLDFSDVLVHIFYEPIRRHYDLEGLWREANIVELPEPYASMAKQFKADEEEEPWDQEADHGTMGSP